MGNFFCIYIVSWTTACLVGIALCIFNREAFALTFHGYWSFLFLPWKVATFIIAASGMTLIAPFTGDPTWDYFDALFMSILTFLTAPWATGVIYKFIRRELHLKYLYIAICIWMFSASWSYDLYLLIRDGYYPITWHSNMFASSVLYFSAGLMWNLSWFRGRGVIFSFMQKDWPIPPSREESPKIIWYALPFMLLVTLVIVYFFLL